MPGEGLLPTASQCLERQRSTLYSASCAPFLLHYFPLPSLPLPPPGPPHLRACHSGLRCPPAAPRGAPQPCCHCQAVPHRGFFLCMRVPRVQLQGHRCTLQAHAPQVSEEQGRCRFESCGLIGAVWCRAIPKNFPCSSSQAWHSLRMQIVCIRLFLSSSLLLCPSRQLVKVALSFFFCFCCSLSTALPLLPLPSLFFLFTFVLSSSSQFPLMPSSSPLLSSPSQASPCPA